MSGKDTFNFRECYELLNTNSKTFHRWLDKAGIKPKENPADPRERLVIKADVITLAEQNGRTLPAWFHEETEPPEPITVENIAERMATFQQQTIQRFDQVDRVLARIETLLQEIAVQQQALPERTTQGFDQLHQSLTQAIASLGRMPSQGPEIAARSNGAQASVREATSEPAPAHPVAAAATPKATKQAAPPTKSRTSSQNRKKKKTARGRKPPAGLVLLRDFAGKHHIVTERASKAGKDGKIKIVQGKWMVNSRWATEALDAQGQHNFYEVFHERAGFTPCEQCPHPLPQQAS